MTPAPEELKRRVRELLARLRQQLRLWLPPQRGIKKTLEEIAEAAPALCDVLDASERREAELRKALEDAPHEPDCPFDCVYGCTCWKSRALNLLKPQPPKP